MRRTGPWLCALALLSTLVIAGPAHAGPSFSVNDGPQGDFPEGDSGTKNYTFRVKLSPASNRTTKVDYKAIEGGPPGSPFDGPAKRGSDFVATEGTLTFAPGETVKRVKVPVIGDKANEVTFEQFFLKLSDPIRASISRAKGGGVILNDDPLPNFTYSDESPLEGTGLSTNSIQVDVSLTEASGRQVKLEWFVEDDFVLSDPDGVDFAGGSGTFTWQPGQTTKTINIPITPDNTDEDDQVVGIGFGGQVNAAMDIDHDHEATIADDDAEPTVSLGNGSGLEGDESNFLEIPLIWSAPTEKFITGTSWSIAHVTTDDADFFSSGGSILGYVSSLSVGVSGDTTGEANETFTVTLGGTPTNVSYGSPTSATGTITDDD